jgi:hypothetical protein
LKQLLAIVLLHAFAVFDFPDVEDEEDRFSTDQLPSRFFLKGDEVITMVFPPFLPVLKVAGTAGSGLT